MLAACLGAPLAASAQPAGGPDSGGPPPAVRAKLDAIAAQAKTDGYAALSPDHRANVSAVVAKVTAGTLEPRAAAAQIDALLTPDERTAILAVAAKSRTQMRAAFGGSMPPPPDGAGPPPGAAAPPPEAASSGRRQMTAGGFLLRVSITPEQMRALRAQRQDGAPPQ